MAGGASPAAVPKGSSTGFPESPSLLAEGFPGLSKRLLYWGEKGRFVQQRPAHTSRQRAREILLVMSWAQKGEKKAVIEDFPLVIESLKTTHDSRAGRDLLQPKQSRDLCCVPTAPSPDSSSEDQGSAAAPGHSSHWNQARSSQGMVEEGRAWFHPQLSPSFFPSALGNRDGCLFFTWILHGYGYSALCP